MSNSVAVIILTYNEEANLPAALDSVKEWASEIFVVDSMSTDRTVDIALERADEGVQVVQHKFEDYSKQWNWALQNLPISADWTLKLDADERVTEAFKQEFGPLAERTADDVHGVLFRRRLFFIGKPLRFGGTRDNFDLRLWRSGTAVFEDRAINEHALVKGQTVKMASMVEHHDYKSISDWLDKHNRYSSLEAISLIKGNVTGGISPRFFGSPIERRMWLRTLYRKTPARPLLYFLFKYIGCCGFLDGVTGFRYWSLRMNYYYWIDLKLAEWGELQRMPTVVSPPRGAPDPRLQNSALQNQVYATTSERAA